MTRTRDPEYRAFLERLRQARRDAGLGQVEVAKRLRKPQSFVSKSESGERRIDVIELAKFASIYGKALEYFMSPLDSGEPEPKRARKVRAKKSGRRS